MTSNQSQAGALEQPSAPALEAPPSYNPQHGAVIPCSNPNLYPGQPAVGAAWVGEIPGGYPGQPVVGPAWVGAIPGSYPGQPVVKTAYGGAIPGGYPGQPVVGPAGVGAIPGGYPGPPALGVGTIPISGNPNLYPGLPAEATADPISKKGSNNPGPPAVGSARDTAPQPSGDTKLGHEDTKLGYMDFVPQFVRKRLLKENEYETFRSVICRKLAW